ncbi:uncharacterized protein LOC122221624 [Panthera leo]|uniref:uncharacterized protein LOC122221624 n=1 Tax=Panthera leo TaxID=9689 RepID=UPI001C6A033F|nr:uncharacterized protein LOC122221624 [Panthera leo]
MEALSFPICKLESQRKLHPHENCEETQGGLVPAAQHGGSSPEPVREDARGRRMAATQIHFCLRNCRWSLLTSFQEFSDAGDGGRCRGWSLSVYSHHPNEAFDNLRNQPESMDPISGHLPCACCKSPPTGRVKPQSLTQSTVGLQTASGVSLVLGQPFLAV